jgi:hypothetical protein
MREMSEKPHPFDGVTGNDERSLRRGDGAVVAAEVLDDQPGIRLAKGMEHAIGSAAGDCIDRRGASESDREFVGNLNQHHVRAEDALPRLERVGRDLVELWRLQARAEVFEGGNRRRQCFGITREAVVFAESVNGKEVGIDTDRAFDRSTFAAQPVVPASVAVAAILLKEIRGLCGGAGEFRPGLEPVGRRAHHPQPAGL